MELIVIKSSENLETSLNLLRSEPSVLAYDTETNGLNPRKDKVISFSCASLGRAYNFVRYGYDPETDSLREYLTAEEFREALLVLKGKRIVTWNGAFDIPFTANSCGVDLNPAWTNDAMLMLHTLDENRFSYGLKETATQEFGAAVKQEQSDLAASINANNGSKGEIWRGDVDLVAKYALQDAILTRKLYGLFDMRLRHEKLDAFHNEEVFTLYKEVTVPMEQHGIQLNMLLLNDMAYKISGEINLLKHKMHKLVENDLSDFYSWQAGKKVKLEFTGNLRRKFCELYGIGFPKSETGSIITSASALKVKKNNVPDSHAKRVILGEERADPKLLLEAQKALIAEEAAISSEPYGFLFTSKDHLKRLLFTSWKLKALSKTPTGQPQVNEETISHYAADEKLTEQQKQFFNLLNYFNRLVKLNGTYYQRFLDEQEDGIFYPRFFQHKTVSGRYGSDVQQLPRPIDGEQFGNLKEYVNSIRKLFVAREGKTFVINDYLSLEPHVFAHVSNDERLINIFNRGDDFYSTIAIMTEGRTEYSASPKDENYLGKQNKQLRQSAKAYALGIAYGLGGFKLHHELGIKLSDAEKLVRNYLKAFPDLAEWMIASEEQAVNNGFVTTQLGRKRRFKIAPQMFDELGEALSDHLTLWKYCEDKGLDWEAMKKKYSQYNNELNNAKNFQIQGLAASITNRACILINREFKERQLRAIIVAQIHDEVDVECDESNKEVIGEIIQRNMENAVKLKLKLTATPSYGYNLAEAKG